MAVFVRPWGQQPTGKYPAWKERVWPWRYKATCSQCHTIQRGWRFGKVRAVQAGHDWHSQHWANRPSRHRSVTSTVAP